MEDGGLEPEDEAMRYCPVCKCKGTVDIPSSNRVKARRNEEKLSVYKKEREEWEEFKASGGVDSCSRVGYRGKITDRAPRVG